MDDVTSATFGTAALEASHARAVLVDVWGPRCAPCLALKPWVEQFAASRSESLRVVNLNATDNRALCFQLQIMGVPTFVLYRNGLEVWRLTGNQCTPASIRDKIA